MKIAIYLASSLPKDREVIQQVEKCGDWIGDNKHTLVYGGACLGLMNILAQHVLDHGGEVIGVMPQFMIDAGRNRTDLTQLIVTEDMSMRKKTMMDLADTFLAFPGGPGTLEEITEVISSSRLNRLNGAKVACLNFKHYYDPLKQMMKEMLQANYVQEKELRDVFYPETIEEFISMMEENKGEN